MRTVSFVFISKEAPMLYPERIKSLFSNAVNAVAGRISEFAVNPGKDLTRSRKLPPEKLIRFLVSEGSQSTKDELLDFFGMDPDAPSDSALNQQRAKLKPEAVETVFRNFCSAAEDLNERSGYRFIAADGSTITYFSKPCFSPEEYYCSPGSSAKGVYSMHVNAFYDLQSRTYTDAVIQSVHKKDEFRAFCDIVDRHAVLPGTKNVYIGDRGYCSYNNMAHVVEKGQHFLFRTKDIDKKGLVGNFDYPDSDSFDVTVTVVLVRTTSKKVHVADGYRRFIDKASSFDFIEYGSDETYTLTFRVVRFALSEDSYECLVTNLPADEFPPEKLKELYFSRWIEETSFRKLKYTIGLSNFHSYKPDYVKQEIWARLIAYNITEILINQTIVIKKDTKHDYKVSFSVAAHICRKYLRPFTQIVAENVVKLLQKELIPIRKHRKYPRLQTAHFRRPRYFIYRAA